MIALLAQLAFTTCAGPVPVSYVRTDMLTADSLRPYRHEVLAHEAVHRRQMAERGGAAGCAPARSAAELLIDEVRAYCVSFDVPRRRGEPADSIAARYRDILIAQFSPHFHHAAYALVMATWAHECPTKARMPE